MSGSLPRVYEPSFWLRVRKIERRQWWLWASASVITLLLTIGMASFSFLFDQTDPSYSLTLRDSVRGLMALVFLFDLYTIYQQIQIHRIRRRLSDQEQMFRLITENAEDLITVVDRDGNRLYDSPAYSRLGYSDQELESAPFSEQIHPEDRGALLEAKIDAADEGSSPRIEYRFQRKDGEWRYLESTRSPVRNSEGEIERIIIVSRDVTERKHAEELLRRRDEQLRQSQKMEAVGRLSGGIAHDFNNLLGVIIGYSESIEYRLLPNDPVRKSAQEIRRAGERAAALTSQLLAFSRQQALQTQVLDLNALVTDMGTMLKRLIGAHIELTTHLGSSLGKVKAEQSQIEQVLVNLVVNARDAMPGGGALLIETSNIVVDEDLASNLPFLQPGPHVLLSVKDTGVGMDASTRRHIFEPFFTTKRPGKGTGLGLATVYGVVTQTGGGITVDSALGEGSTFKIYLPQTQEALSKPRVDEDAVADFGGKGTILVAEDEEALLNLTAERLTESGYTVLTARDGEEALEVERSYTGTIHLLLTDVVMPKMGGVSLARNISKSRPGIRIAFMTGHAEHESAFREAVRSGADSIEKPFSNDRLVRLVRRAIEASSVSVQD